MCIFFTSYCPGFIRKQDQSPFPWSSMGIQESSLKLGIHGPETRAITKQVCSIKSKGKATTVGVSTFTRLERTHPSKVCNGPPNTHPASTVSQNFGFHHQWVFTDDEGGQNTICILKGLGGDNWHVLGVRQPGRPTMTEALGGPSPKLDG